MSRVAHHPHSASQRGSGGLAEDTDGCITRSLHYRLLKMPFPALLPPCREGRCAGAKEGGKEGYTGRRAL
ncbi:hypothetical protein E2C01_074674 [Portunus trituberculatus]|uniref:Uncharacterized protein n=1 Tax=Portunus trituberculatus TaxID=210409 RepID=A0A5B7IEW7_PORTR|nr:hypothetical protein [Portunus trituberculatus]